MNPAEQRSCCNTELREIRVASVHSLIFGLQLPELCVGELEFPFILITFLWEEID